MQICKSITASADCEEIIKLIYLRRYFEIVDERGDAYRLGGGLGGWGKDWCHYQ